MNLEEQVQQLDKLGLKLNEGVTIDDLLYSFDRQGYEKKPFDLLLFIYGVQVERPPYQRVCNNVWNFDTECIVSNGDYVRIVKELCKLSGDENYLTNIEDLVNLGSKKAWLKYQVGTKSRNWIVEVNDDWVDRMTFSYLIEDIERDGKRFYYKDNGQAMILFYLDEESAKQLNAVSNNALSLVNSF